MKNLLPISRTVFSLERLRDFARDTRGVTAIEYGLIATAVFLGIVGPVHSMANSMNVTYTDILNYFSAV